MRCVERNREVKRGGEVESIEMWREVARGGQRWRGGERWKTGERCRERCREE